MVTDQRIPSKAAIAANVKVRYCREQLQALERLGYISSWNHEQRTVGAGVHHYFTISTTDGGYYDRLPLNSARIYLAGMLAGARGRDVFAGTENA